MLMLMPAGISSLSARETARESSAPPARLMMAVLGLEDPTNDPELAHWRCAAGLFAEPLQKVKALRVLSGGPVRYALHQVGLRPGAPIDPNQARQVGELLEVQRVIWGDYSRSADRWQVHLRVMRVATGAVSSVFSADASDWFDLRDKLTEQILAELGIVPSAEERNKMTERWTSSAEALEWLLRGNLAQEQEKPASEQERLYCKAIAADPNCAAAHARLAATLATQGKSDVAQRTAGKALQLQPDCEGALFVLGWLARDQRRLAQAETQFRQVCRLSPDNADNLMWLATALLEQGKLDEARSLFEKAVVLDRTNSMAHACLAIVYALRQQRQDALQEVEEARRYMPEGLRSGTLSAVASAYEKLGRRSEAIECYERMLPLYRQLGMDPNVLRQIERQIQRLRSTLAPTYLQAAPRKRYTEEALDQIFRNRLTENERELVADPFSCSDAMRQWARELTQGADKDSDKARALCEALAVRLNPPGSMKSRTAREVYEAWENPQIRLVCMDRAVLFVALARAVGLNAFFVNVNKNPDGTVMHHACGAVFLAEGVLLADPTLHWFGAPHQQYRILDDLQAAAFLCFNNRDGDPRELPACRAGLKLWPESLQGQLALAAALWQTRQSQEAHRVLSAVDEPRSNDYEAALYWSYRGRAALDEQDWKEAEAHLRKAIALYPGARDTHYNLGSLYWEQHRWVEARAAFRACLRNDPSPMLAGLAQHYIAQINEKINFETAPDLPVPERKPQ